MGRIYKRIPAGTKKYRRKRKNMKLSTLLQGSKPSFVFNKSSKDFEVEEVPLYEFTGSGEHTIIKIRKKDMTTWEAVNALSSATGVKARDIGYAGLKDKEGSTIEYFSLICKEDVLSAFSHDRMKILSTTRHANKLKPGHLKGNNFKLRLKKVLPKDAGLINSLTKELAREGMPNYFGFQRFGNDGKNHELGRQIAEGTLKERNKELKKLLISAYQSYLFNEWLSLRVQMSHLAKMFKSKELAPALNILMNQQGIELKFDETTAGELTAQPQFFKLLQGDSLCHYPYGRLFSAENVLEEAGRFVERQLSPTGLLDGEKQKKSDGMAYKIEEKFVKNLHENGDRRYAWVFVENLKTRYNEEEAQLELEFYLPKGCYATVLLAELGFER